MSTLSVFLLSVPHCGTLFIVSHSNNQTNKETRGRIGDRGIIDGGIREEGNGRESLQKKALKGLALA
jgi:hypothetical protein